MLVITFFCISSCGGGSGPTSIIVPQEAVEATEELVPVQIPTSWVQEPTIDDNTRVIVNSWVDLNKGELIIIDDSSADSSFSMERSRMFP